jgi:hypothetical protein
MHRCERQVSLAATCNPSSLLDTFLAVVRRFLRCFGSRVSINKRVGPGAPAPSHWINHMPPRTTGKSYRLEPQIEPWLTLCQRNFEPRSRSFPGAHPYRYTSRYPYTGCSFLEGFALTLKTLLQKGRPFIMCEIRGKSTGAVTRHQDLDKTRHRNAR